MARSITPSIVRQHVEIARRAGYMPYFESASKRCSVPLEVLLAIASRESSMGLTLDRQFKGDRGNGWGLMQIDRRHHSDFTSRTDPRDYQAIIDYAACHLLRPLYEQLGSWRGAMAAYNTGPEDVLEAIDQGADIDRATTGGDYSADVAWRAGLIRDHLGIAPRRAGLQALSIALVVGAGSYLIGTYLIPSIEL